MIPDIFLLEDFLENINKSSEVFRIRDNYTENYYNFKLNMTYGVSFETVLDNEFIPS